MIDDMTSKKLIIGVSVAAVDLEELVSSQGQNSSEEEQEEEGIELNDY